MTSRSLAGAFLWAFGLASIYAIAAFSWSFLGFASPTPPVHFHEYALGALATEVGGHIVFGVVAALPTLDPDLILLAGGESVLIDMDHLLAAQGYPVGGRLAHSVFFALVAALLLAYLARKSGRPARGAFFVTLSSVAAHVSYDVFAGNGSFAILSPVSLASYAFPEWTWPLLLGLGFVMNVLSTLVIHRFR